MNDDNDIALADDKEIGKCQLFFYRRIDQDTEDQPLHHPAASQTTNFTNETFQADKEETSSTNTGQESMDVDSNCDERSLAAALQEPLRMKMKKQMTSTTSWTFLDTIQKELDWWLLMENKEGKNSWFISSINAIILTMKSANVYVYSMPEDKPKEKWSFSDIFKFMYHAFPGSILDVSPIIDKFLSGHQALVSPDTLFGFDAFENNTCPWSELKHQIVKKTTTEPCKCSKTNEATTKEEILTQTIFTLYIPPKVPKRSRKEASMVTLQNLVNLELVKDVSAKCSTCENRKLTSKVEMALTDSGGLHNQGFIIQLQRSCKEDEDNTDFEISQSLELPTENNDFAAFNFICSIQNDKKRNYHVNFKANSETIIEIRDNKDIICSNAKNVKKSELFFYAKKSAPALVPSDEEMMMGRSQDIDFGSDF